MSRRTHIPGVSVDAERNIADIVTAFENRLRVLERKSGRAGVVETDTAAKAGEFLNVEAPAAGLTIILPQATPALRNARVGLNFRNANPVRLTCILGLVNRAAFVISNQVGTFDAVCDGLDGWSVQLGLTEAGPSGGALDAEYLVGAAHSSLPNARLATDSTEIDADLTVANVVSWVLRTASVVFAKLQDLTGLSVLGRAASSTGVMAAITATGARQALLSSSDGTSIGWRSLQAADEASTWSDVLGRGATSGANDPVIDAGQSLRFAQTGGSPAGGDIDADGDLTLDSATDMHLHSHGALHLGHTAFTTVAHVEASTQVDITSGGDITEIAATTIDQQAGTDWTASAVSGNVQLNASGFCRVVTGGVNRLEIGSAGGWTINATEGTAGQYVRNFGPGATPQWATIVISDIPGLVSSGAVTGAVTIAAGGGASTFSGIRVNGIDVADQPNLNFVNTSLDVSWSIINDPGNNELEIRAATLGSFYSENSVGAIQTKFINFEDGNGTTAVVDDDTGGSGYINVSFPLASIAGLSVLARSANTSGIPAAVTASAARQVFRVNDANTALEWGNATIEVEENNSPEGSVDTFNFGNGDGVDMSVFVAGGEALVQPNIDVSDFAGEGLEDDGSENLRVVPDNDRHIIRTSDGVGWRKSRHRNFWFDDFDYVPDVTLDTSGQEVRFGNTTWYAVSVSTNGSSISALNTAIQNHPGVLILTNNPDSGATHGVNVYRAGPTDTDGMTEARDFYMFEVIMRQSTALAILTHVGLKGNPISSVASNVDGIYFVYDTTEFSGGNIHCVTDEGGTFTSTDTGISMTANAWFVYTAIQESVGTVDFYIDDVLEATHSTNVPDSEDVNFCFYLFDRDTATAAKTLQIDYVAYESQDLGART